MSPRCRNIFVAFLLGLFSLQILLPLAICVSIGMVKVSQSEFIRENYLKKEVFQRIVLTEEQYQKMDGGELEFEGVMYDVHSVSVKDGKYVVTVLSDEKETGLKKIQAAQEKEDGEEFAPVLLSLYIEQPLKFSFERPAVPAGHEAVSLQFPSENVRMIPGPPPDAKA